MMAIRKRVGCVLAEHIKPFTTNDGNPQCKLLLSKTVLRIPQSQILSKTVACNGIKYLPRRAKFTEITIYSDGVNQNCTIDGTRLSRWVWQYSISFPFSIF
jgi:hypothetical protein